MRRRATRRGKLVHAKVGVGVGGAGGGVKVVLRLSAAPWRRQAVEVHVAYGQVTMRLQGATPRTVRGVIDKGGVVHPRNRAERAAARALEW